MSDDKNIDYKRILYNLKPDNPEDNYYLLIKNFIDIVLNKAKEDIGEIISDFQLYLAENSVDNVYIRHYPEENAFEALYLGVLWKLYIDEAIKLDPFNQKILSKLSNLRNKKDILNSPYKNQIDDIRGPLATKYLHDINNKNKVNDFTQVYIKNLNLSLDLLLNYLEATGDYNESLKHLKIWKDFLISKNEKISIKYFNLILKFTKWFENFGKKD